jgi:hypothetical protein
MVEKSSCQINEKLMAPKKHPQFSPKKIKAEGAKNSLLRMAVPELTGSFLTTELLHHLYFLSECHGG